MAEVAACEVELHKWKFCCHFFLFLENSATLFLLLLLHLQCNAMLVAVTRPFLCRIAANETKGHVIVVLKHHAAVHIQVDRKKSCNKHKNQQY